MLRRWRKAQRGLVSTLLAGVLVACHSIGPGTVPRDRIDYMASLSSSWKQQTLLNVVKLRYADVPVFLEVSQVIAGYQLQTSVVGGATAGNANAATIGSFVISGTAGAQGTYTDRPTVIYAPLTGVDFLKQLMTPIPPNAVLFLLQSGYSARLTMGITLESINGVSNESVSRDRPADPGFPRLVQLLTELQQNGSVEMRIDRGKDGEASLIVFNPSEDPDVQAKREELRRILGLRQDAREFHVRYGGYSGASDEIAMATRSMLQIMIELARGARIPDSDVTEGRAAAGRVEDGPAGSAVAPLATILTGASAPEDAYVAVAYRDRWFWIPDTDIQSKTTFGFVMLLYSISGTGVRSGAPVVTVPANQ